MGKVEGKELALFLFDSLLLLLLLFNRLPPDITGGQGLKKHF